MHCTYECREVVSKETLPEKRWGATLSIIGEKIILFGGYIKFVLHQ